MHHLMARFWWILVLRGMLGILLGLVSTGWIIYLDQKNYDIFGLSVFLGPMALMATLVFLLGIYAFLDGLFAITLGAQDYGDGRRWWFLIMEGILSLGLGLLTWLEPNLTVLFLLYWIAAWAVFTGLLEIFQGFEMNEYKDRRKTFLFAGLCSAVFGLLVLLPGMGGPSLVWLMGAYAFLFGFPLLVLGLHLRSYVKKGHVKGGRTAKA